jgi:hypothetical protein
VGVENLLIVDVGSRLFIYAAAPLGETLRVRDEEVPASPRLQEWFIFVMLGVESLGCPSFAPRASNQFNKATYATRHMELRIAIREGLLDRKTHRIMKMLASYVSAVYRVTLYIHVASLQWFVRLLQHTAQALVLLDTTPQVDDSGRLNLCGAVRIRSCLVALRG